MTPATNPGRARPRRSRYLGATALCLLVACAQGEDEPRTVALADAPAAAAVADTLVVYKTPTCGCCSQWIEHMERNGFTVVAHDDDAATLNRRKAEVGLTNDLVSCHTASIGGYIVEGHVPADLVRRMLRERPQIAGLAVPGMPIGSPGMEGGIKQDYNVIAYRRDGSREVYATR